jgi:hypothetical protein
MENNSNQSNQMEVPRLSQLYEKIQDWQSGNFHIDLIKHEELLPLLWDFRVDRDYSSPLLFLAKEYIKEHHFRTARIFLIALKILDKKISQETFDDHENWKFCLNYEITDCETNYNLNLLKYFAGLKKRKAKKDPMEMIDDFRSFCFSKLIDEGSEEFQSNFITKFPTFEESEILAGQIIKSRNFVLDNYEEYLERSQKLKHGKYFKSIEMPEIIDQSFNNEFHKDYLRAELYQTITYFCGKHKTICKLAKKSIDFWDPLIPKIPNSYRKVM